MPTKPHPDRLKLLREPIDMSKDGQCSRCGQCCPSIVCVSEEELARLKELAKEVTPVFDRGDPGQPAIYARCPFLIQRKYFPAYCQIYDRRPRVCRTFACSRGNRENAEAYIADGGEAQPAVNLWTLFGLTGIWDEHGEPIPAGNPFHVDVDLSGHRTLRIQVGQPVSLWTSNGRYVPPSLVVGMSKEGLQIFDASGHTLETIPFEDIESMDVPENAVRIRPKGKRKKERKKKNGTQR